MRHLGSFFLTLVLAPAIWVLTGVGVSKLAEANTSSSDVDLAFSLAAFVGAGFCYTLLVIPRLSPVGPMLAGLGMAGLVAWWVVDVDGFERFIPADVLGVSDAARIPAQGYAALLAVPLVAMIFSPRRWTRYDQPPVDYGGPAYQEASAYPPPSMPTAGYPPPGYPADPYSSPGYSNPVFDTDPTLPLVPNDPGPTRRY